MCRQCQYIQMGCDSDTQMHGAPMSPCKIRKGHFMVKKQHLNCSINTAAAYIFSTMIKEAR